MCLLENICVCVEVCDCDEKCRQGVNVCVSLRCLCPCGLYRIWWHIAWASLHTHTRLYTTSHQSPPSLHALHSWLMEIPFLFPAAWLIKLVVKTVLISLPPRSKATRPSNDCSELTESCWLSVEEPWRISLLVLTTVSYCIHNRLMLINIHWIKQVR